MTVLRRPPTWDESKKQLGDPSFMQKLLEFDKDKLDDALLKKIGKFTVNPDFTPESVGKVCALKLLVVENMQNSISVRLLGTTSCYRI